jgi:hypothetical protein
MKGLILEQLGRNGRMWDYEIADEVMNQLGLSGEYWYGTMRLTLTDLFSGGLITECGTDVDPSKSLGEEKILFRFELTDFGRKRMDQAGLVGGTKK